MMVKYFALFVAVLYIAIYFTALAFGATEIAAMATGSSLGFNVIYGFFWYKIASEDL